MQRLHDRERCASHLNTRVAHCGDPVHARKTIVKGSGRSLPVASTAEVTLALRPDHSVFVCAGTHLWSGAAISTR